MPTYKFIYFDGRGRGEYIRYLFAMAGVPYEEELVSDSDWFQKVKPEAEKNWPFAFLPMLEVDGPENKIQQHLAIGRYIAQAHGLAPEGHYKRALCDMYVDGASAAFHPPIDNWFILKYIQSKPEEADKVIAEFAKGVLPNECARYQSFLNKNGTGWLVGDKPTWADVYVGESLYRIKDTLVPDSLNDFPDLEAYVQRVLDIPGIKAFLETRKRHDF